MNRREDANDTPNTEWPVIMFVGYGFPIREFRQYLAKRDAVFVTQQRGAETALEYLRDEGFEVDWAVIDLKLRGKKNGLHLTVEIRAEEAEYNRRIKIIWATTATPEDEGYSLIEAAARKLGVDRIIQKPYDPIRLFEELSK